MRSWTLLLCTMLGASAAYASTAMSKIQIHILTAEPAPGTLGRNKVVYVDDGSWPAGQIKMVVGAPDMHTERQRSCVPH